MYDVVVIGAGPAGSSTAKTIAENNLKVLLIERELEIGVPDKCGEFLPSLNEMIRLAPDVNNLKDIFDIPNHCIVNRTKYVRFVFPNDLEIKVEFEGWIVERKIFDKYLANEAARAGVDLLPATKVIGLLKGGSGVRVVSHSETKDIKSKIIVAADGTYSFIARRSGLPVSRDPHDYGVGFQYEMVNVEQNPQCVEMYIGEDIAPGTYAWIIPKGKDVANVGTGVRIPYMKKGLNIRDYQRQFIERYPPSSMKLRKAQPTAVKAGCIPVGGPHKRTSTNNMLAVGDAGGHTIPTVGGGVPPGLICGRIAGQVVTEHIHKGDPITNFDEAWKKQIGKTLENSLRIRKMSDVVFKNTKMINWITKRGWLTEEMVEKFILCDFDIKMRLLEKSLGIVG